MRELVHEGAKALAAALRADSRRLTKRRDRLKARKRKTDLVEKRIQWLGVRIANRLKASKWLDAHAEQLEAKVVDALSEKIGDAIPEDAPVEDFAKWRKAAAERQAKRQSKRAKRKSKRAA